MAIGTITVGTGAGKASSAPTFFDPISFAGDGAYGAGGTADFEGSFQTKIGCARTIVAIIPGDCGGYVPVYDRANDKLLVYEGNYDAGDGPLQETATADLSATTFNLVVVSQ